MFLMRGLAFVVRADNIGIKHSFFYHLINDQLSIPLNPKLSWPFTATCFVVVFLVALFCAHFTRFGRNIYALGGDENSARLMGLPVGRTKIMTYAVAGFWILLGTGGCRLCLQRAKWRSVGRRWQGTGGHRRRGDRRHVA
jgi:simple sugar transport system permease protein